MFQLLKSVFCKDKTESVYFYTFHKCASSLFSLDILKHCGGLRHKDYAQEIYSKEKWDKSVSFKPYGYIYGPIRVSARPPNPVYFKLVKNAITDDFIKDKKAIFFVRDPRDVLVSLYYSVGYSHTLSPVDMISASQTKNREEAVSMTVDEYALKYANLIAEDFNAMFKLVEACPCGVLLRYEDMIDDFDPFIQALTSIVSLDADVVNRIFTSTRPKQEENILEHRRSGKVHGFSETLQADTIDKLNNMLADVLKKFNYV